MNKPRLLLLSDIHFNKVPSIDIMGIRNKGYLNSFKEEIFKINPKPTHIIINGDMVFSAKYEQYKECYDFLFKDYLNNNKSVRFITIPGNHSCQRVVPKLIFEVIKDKTGIKFEIDTLEKKKNFENELIKVINKKDYKNDILEKLAENIDADYRSFLTGKQNIDLFELLFHNYSRFVKENIIERFNSINQKSSVLEFSSYQKSGGVSGVIYDIEYNIAFACLNGVSYSWGEELFDDLKKDNIISKVFNEYGNLSLRNSVDIVSNDLTKLATRNILDQTLFCLLCHVPFSWLSYESLKSKTELSYILEKSDVAFFSHIHSEYFSPSVYRHNSYFFETPQIFDFRFEEMHDAEINDNIKNSLGFSVFDFFQDDYKFYQITYNLSPKVDFRRKGENYFWEWESKLHEYELINPKKFPVFFYDCFKRNERKIIIENFLNPTCEYIRYIQGYASPKREIDYSVKICDDIKIDLQRLLVSYFNAALFIERQDNFLIFKENKNLHVVCDIFSIIEPSDLFAKINSLLNRIEYETLKSISNIQIIFFDYSLFYIFANSNEFTPESDWIEIFRNWRANLRFWEIKLKARFFSELMKSACVEANIGELSIWGEIGINFDIIKLINYKNHLVRTK